MKKLEPNNVAEYVEKNIGDFHQNRIKSISALQLDKILKRKNPYLFKAKNILTSEELVKTFMDAHLSSQEETMFGEFLEGLAIFIAGEVFDGKKSAAEGIDLEFDKNGIRYIVSIKSGPNWGNSSQIAKMKISFKQAKRILNTNKGSKNVVAVNGCCYGKDANPDKGEYIKYCGQDFWEFISGNENLFKDIIEPLGYEAKERNDEFVKAYAQVVNKFTLEFSEGFCDDGNINWGYLIEFNSGK